MDTSGGAVSFGLNTRHGLEHLRREGEPLTLTRVLTLSVAFSVAPMFPDLFKKILSFLSLDVGFWLIAFFSHHVTMYTRIWPPRFLRRNLLLSKLFFPDYLGVASLAAFP